MPELRFRYEEEPNAEEFFCPFVWELAVGHPAFRYYSPSIKLFRQVQLPRSFARWRGRRR